MAAFVLIHGAWHGAWCWHKVVDALRAEGHRVVAPDLPGHGEDPEPPAKVTLESYGDRACEAIDAQDEDVILVGHSMGGFVISLAADRRPERIRKLVYLAAFIPTPGETFAQGTAETVTPALLESTIPVEDGSAVNLRPESLREVFYADCSDEDVAFARERLCPQPVRPTVTPIELTPERFGSVPRYYIECRQDATILLADQKKLHESHACRAVYSLDASHSPFFSQPQRLAETLMQISAPD
jgi:pimeloyl-ACP methyl ester carboxylesterase